MLNTAIPIGIIVFFVGLLYMKLREPINQFFQWVKSLFSSASDKIPDVSLPTEIVYR
jgi:hypothetical protein